MENKTKAYIQNTLCFFVCVYLTNLNQFYRGLFKISKSSFSYSILFNSVKNIPLQVYKVGIFNFPRKVIAKFFV